MTTKRCCFPCVLHFPWNPNYCALQALFYLSWLLLRNIWYPYLIYVFFREWQVGLWLFSWLAWLCSLECHADSHFLIIPCFRPELSFIASPDLKSKTAFGYLDIHLLVPCNLSVACLKQKHTDVVEMTHIVAVHCLRHSLKLKVWIHINWRLIPCGDAMSWLPWMWGSNCTLP